MISAEAPSWEPTDAKNCGMALIEVTEEWVRTLVDSAVFGQAAEWADKVTGLHVDGLLVEATVDGVPSGFRVLHPGIEGRCGCPLPAPCAHAIAIALAWVRTGHDAEQSSELFEMLRVQDRDWLAARLAELATADPALAARLLDEAEDAGVLGEIVDLRAEFDEVLDELEAEARDEGEYGEWYPDAEGLDELFDEAEALIDNAPDAVQDLADHLLERIERILDYSNCYGGGVTEALTRAEDLHLDACREGSPDPVRLAERLVSGALQSGWGSLDSMLPEYAEVLGTVGLARCRELVAQATGTSHSLQTLRNSLVRIEEGC
jgi:uncharacterized Zn finger protein